MYLTNLLGVDGFRHGWCPNDITSEHGLPISSALASPTVTLSPGGKWILVVSGVCHPGCTHLFLDGFSRASGMNLIGLD